MPNPLRVHDLTEEDLLARILPLLPTTALLGPGDDCALVAAPDTRFVVTTDVLVQERHFRTEWSTGADVGWRAAMSNLADVVAMGARPSALVVALVLPGRTRVSWVEDFATGLGAACRLAGASVVGGDLSGGEQIVVAITAHGDLQGAEPVRRSGARAGQTLAVAGTLGRSAAGLALLSAGTADATAAHLSGPLAPCVRTYLRPCPPLNATVTDAAALMDVSDGLLRDAGRIAKASKVRLNLEGASLAPFADALRPAAAALAGTARHLDLAALTREWVLTGGEDHALLGVFPPHAVPPDWISIGQVVDGPSGVVTLDDQTPHLAVPGWDHFGT